MCIRDSTQTHTNIHTHTYNCQCTCRCVSMYVHSLLYLCMTICVCMCVCVCVCVCMCAYACPWVWVCCSLSVCVYVSVDLWRRFPDSAVCNYEYLHNRLRECQIRCWAVSRIMYESQESTIYWNYLHYTRHSRNIPILSIKMDFESWIRSCESWILKPESDAN